MRQLYGTRGENEDMGENNFYSAPNADTKPTTLEKSSYSPQSQKLTLREQLLETPVPCDMAKHAARENNLAAGTRV